MGPLIQDTVVISVGKKIQSRINTICQNFAFISVSSSPAVDVGRWVDTAGTITG